MRFQRLTALLCACALAMVGLAAAPSATAASKSTITVKAAATVILKGSSTTLTATYRPQGKPAKSGTLKAQRLRGTKWVTFKTVKVSSKGTARVTVKPRVNASYRFISANGKVKSKTRTVKIRSTVSISASQKSISKGSKVTLTAKYTYGGQTAKSGTLWAQRLRGTTWKTFKKMKVSSKGTVKLTVGPQVTASYRIVTYKSKTVSPTAKISVAATPDAAAPDTFVVSGSGFGHGVGMSQYGAYQMALEGNSVAKILTHYYPGTKVATQTTPKNITVQVFGPEPYRFKGYADTAKSTTFTITSGTWRLKDGSKTLATGTKTDNVTLSVSKGKVQATITTPDGSTKVTGESLKLSWSSSAVAKLSGANGTYKYGTLTASVVGTKLNVNNRSTLRQYLYGLAEMPSSWGEGKGKAALQAQAIAGRNYAVQSISNGAKTACGGCHLVDDVRDQNFTGWKKAGEASSGTNEYYGKIWRAAVDATTTSDTSSKLMTYKGKVVQAYYYSSTGGRTANSEDVWVATIDYLRSVNDVYSLKAPGNTMRSWKRELSQSSAESIFGVKDIVQIKVSSKYSSGQMKTLTATTATGQTAKVTGKADWLRSKLGLPAAWVTSIS